MRKRKICVVITARPTYSRFKTALFAIQNHSKLELQLVVAGSAILDTYGNIDKIIEEDGLKIAQRVNMVIAGENLVAMAKTTGMGLIELATTFSNLKPDAVVTIADRSETLATAIAASYMNIPLIHIQGGEITGSIDEKVRHAVSKLADLHFVATQKAKERLHKMGEQPSKVYVTGCPSIDLAKTAIETPCINSSKLLNLSGVGAEIDINREYIVVMQHPVTTEYYQSKTSILETLKAIYELRIPTFWFWPNVDAGSDGTSRGIRSFREKHTLNHIQFIKNLNPTDFLKLLLGSKGLIGNSSAGIRECAYLGVPVINIGSRQENRERGENVCDVGHDASEIINATKNMLSQNKFKQNTLYGTGNAGIEIASLISKVSLTHEKRLTI
jgi:UDP-hydrolysing UDP-N-acetyl-D-glucosamine 2-epimerase